MPPNPQVVKKAEKEQTSIACADGRHEDCSTMVLRRRWFQCQCSCHPNAKKPT